MDDFRELQYRHPAFRQLLSGGQKGPAGMVPLDLIGSTMIAKTLSGCSSKRNEHLAFFGAVSLFLVPIAFYFCMLLCARQGWSFVRGCTLAASERLLSASCGCVQSTVCQVIFREIDVSGLHYMG